MKEYFKNLLSETEIFKNLSDEAVEFYINNGEISEFKKGDIIYSR